MSERRAFGVGLGCGAIVPMLVLSTTIFGAAQTQPATPNVIIGVWRVVEQTINGRTLTGDQLGIGYHIWTKGYF